MSGPSGWPTILPSKISEREPASEGAADDPTRVVVEVVTTSNRTVAVEFRVRLETVEVWSWQHCGGIFDRERLRAWLAAPRRWVAEGEVVLSVDPRSDGDRVAVSLPDVATWTLSPKDLSTLRERV